MVTLCVYMSVYKFTRNDFPTIYYIYGENNDNVVTITVCLCCFGLCWLLLFLFQNAKSLKH